MNRKRYLTESMEDLSNQIVNNVYDTLIQWHYEQGEIDNIVNRDSIEIDITNNKCILHCGDEIIYSAPSNIYVNEFISTAEEALLNWCIQKIGREPETIVFDAADLFSDMPDWNKNKFNESKNINKNRIRLTESEFKTLVESSVKQVLSEISWSTAGDAAKKSENRVDLLDYAWPDFEMASELLVKSLNGIDDRGYYADYSDPQPHNTQGSKLGKELENLTDKIRDYFNRKKQQSQNLQNKSTEKFNNAFNGRDFYQVADDIEDVRDKYWDSDERNWETYREKHLTPSEIEFDNKYN